MSVNDDIVISPTKNLNFLSNNHQFSGSYDINEQYINYQEPYDEEKMLEKKRRKNQKKKRKRKEKKILA